MQQTETENEINHLSCSNLIILTILHKILFHTMLSTNIGAYMSGLMGHAIEFVFSRGLFISMQTLFGSLMVPMQHY